MAVRPISRRSGLRFSDRTPMPQTNTKNTKNTETLSQLLQPYAQAAEADLERWLVEPSVPVALAEAMRYCVLGGGKRLRPALVHISCEAMCGGVTDSARRAAVAVELVHSYSLVHDDLPAMDDDALRRGRATAHVKFGEAMAILAGDALLTRAFGVLAEVDDGAGLLVAELAAAAGPAGMIAGQVADMGLCDVPDGAEGVGYIHRHKTADLIRASAVMGAICGGAEKSQTDAIRDYAVSLGLAFQLFDDLLDVTAPAEQIGKTPGKDAHTGKRTHVAQMGLERSVELGRQITQKAIGALEPLGDRAEKLRSLTELLSERTH